MIYSKNILTKDSLKKSIYLKSVGAEGCQIVRVSFVALFLHFVCFVLLAVHLMQQMFPCLTCVNSFKKRRGRNIMWQPFHWRIERRWQKLVAAVFLLAKNSVVGWFFVWFFVCFCFVCVCASPNKFAPKSNLQRTSQQMSLFVTISWQKCVILVTQTREQNIPLYVCVCAFWM